MAHQCSCGGIDIGVGIMHEPGCGEPEPCKPYPGPLCPLAFSRPEHADCEQVIGLPSGHPVDAYGKPIGWCWTCWTSHQLARARERIHELEEQVRTATKWAEKEQRTVGVWMTEAERFAVSLTYIRERVKLPSSDLAIEIKAMAEETLRGGRPGPPWMDDLFGALEWQGGTWNDAVRTVRELMKEHKER